MPRAVKEDDAEIQIQGHNIYKRDDYLVNRCQRMVGLTKNNVEPRLENLDVKICAFYDDLKPTLESLTQQNAWLIGQNKELCKTMNQIVTWKLEADVERKNDKILLDKNTATLHAMNQVIDRLKSKKDNCKKAIDNCKQSVDNMNNFILKHNLTSFIENQQKRKKNYLQLQRLLLKV